MNYPRAAMIIKAKQFDAFNTKCYQAAPKTTECGTTETETWLEIRV